MQSCTPHPTFGGAAHLPSLSCRPGPQRRALCPALSLLPCQALFDHIPVGVGSQGIIPTTAKDLEEALEMGMDWSLREVGARCGVGRGGDGCDGPLQ